MKFFKKFDYNAPVTLTFALLCLILTGAGALFGYDKIANIFAVQNGSSWLNPMTYVRFFTQVITHGSWAHFSGNIMLILVLGPILEEKYGSKTILEMICLTALISGLSFRFFYPANTILLGASGIVFMFILLASVTNVKEGTIPITLILILVLYVGGEVIDIAKNDNVSQVAHIVGGILGAAFGMFIAKTGGVNADKDKSSSSGSYLDM